MADGAATSTVTTTASIEIAPAGDPNTIDVWNIADAFETRQRGRNTDYRLVLDVFQDTDADGIAELSDGGIAGVQVTVALRDSNGALIPTLTGQTVLDGVFRSDWIKGLVSGDDTAEWLIWPWKASAGTRCWTWKMNNSCRWDTCRIEAHGPRGEL